MPQMDAFFSVSTNQGISVSALLIIVFYSYFLSTVFYRYTVRQTVKFNFFFKHLILS